MISLHNQRAFKVDRLILADVFDASSDILVERINPKAVFIGVNDLDEAVPEKEPVLGFDEAFEHGFLNSLAVILAGLCDLAKTTPSLVGCRRDIIGNQIEHTTRAFLAKNSGKTPPGLAQDAGNIGFAVSSDMTCEQLGLEEG
jgi:hypothetical protein